MPIASLENRSLICLEGEDVLSFVQGLVTQDVYKVTSQQPLYTAMLTAGGRFFCDFFIIQRDNTLILDVAHVFQESLIKKLSLYRLRSKVAIHQDRQDFAVYALWGDSLSSFSSVLEKKGIFFYQDSRHPFLGIRALVPLKAGKDFWDPQPLSSEEIYRTHCMALTVPAGDKDLTPEKSFILEYGFDELGAIDWQKGCYVGQELTARTKYRGALHKKLFSLKINENAGLLPEKGSPILYKDQAIGEITSALGPYALGMLRLEAVASAQEASENFTCEGSVLSLD